MYYRFLVLFGVASMAIAQTALTAQTAPPIKSAATRPVSAPKAPSAASQPPVIRFEDASDKAGINFTHSFGSRQMGSLLEDTGAGCVWFDYNNSGLESLYVVNGRPLDDSMHPFPLKVKPESSAAQSSLSQQRQRHLYRRDGERRTRSGHVWNGRDGSRL